MALTYKLAPTAPRTITYQLTAAQAAYVEDWYARNKEGPETIDEFCCRVDVITALKRRDHVVRVSVKTDYDATEEAALETHETKCGISTTEYAEEREACGV